MFSSSTSDHWFQQPVRRSTICGDAMIVTSTPQAAMAGYDVLRAGGNAMDAAIASVAVTSVVEASQCGPGGDCFAIVSRPGEAPRAYNGSGRAPAGLTAQHLIAHGVTAIARDSPHAVTVPGAVEGWCRLHQDFGSQELDRLLRPAIGFAEDGYVVQRRIAQDWARNVPFLQASDNAARFYLPGGRAPLAGERHSIPGLGRIFREVAAGGPEAFYTGRIAQDIVTYLRGIGGMHRLEDFAGHRGEYFEPISTVFHGHQVFECPPNGQGLAALIIMNMVQELAGTASLDTVEGIHLLAEISKVAFSIRDGVIADPAMSAMPVDHWLSPRTTKLLAEGIDLSRATPRRPLEQIVPEHPDTNYVAVVDRDGMAVSLISSIFFDFGSTLVEPNSGMLLHNRGLSFKVIEGHPNCVAPGKRPLHTIIPGLLARDGRTVMPFGIVGGHYQPVGHAHMLHAMLSQGLDVQEALNLPRSLCLDGTLQLETTNPPERIAALYALGHPVAAPPHTLGGGHGIFIDHDRGLLIGGTDTRRDGVVAGY